MKPIIEVENISKSYTISHQTDVKAGYDTIKDDFAKLIKKPFGGTGESSRETFWALKNLSFEVNQGEIFGVVGKNGSGKSTLLKILSRIIDPTEGEIRMKGRVASLLEVGTGFHPELTGRENVYFNGSMLGMSRQEIERKFDDIVAFSEVEKFLDTPVKFYSSGMFVRLAFAVAAHLDSEILILDEVLSVGDAGFQRKSLKKIKSTMQEGRTVLFVSHSMGAVQQLCSRGMVLKDGKLEMIGKISDVVNSYLSKNLDQTLDSLDETTSIVKKLKPEMYASSTDKMRFERIELVKKRAGPPTLHFNEPIEIKITINARAPIENCRAGITLQTYDGTMIGLSHSNDNDRKNLPDLGKGPHTFSVRLSNPLRPGKYLLGVSAYEDIKSKKRANMYVPGALSLEILPETESGLIAPEQDTSILTFDGEWTVDEKPD